MAKMTQEDIDYFKKLLKESVEEVREEFFDLEKLYLPVRFLKEGEDKEL